MGAGLVETLNARKQQLQSELTKVERRVSPGPPPPPPPRPASPRAVRPREGGGGS